MIVYSCLRDCMCVLSHVVAYNEDSICRPIKDRLPSHQSPSVQLSNLLQAIRGRISSIMDVLNSVNAAAVQSTWVVIKQDINTYAPKFYVALLTAHPEYQTMFPTIANVPAGDLLNNAALKTLSVNVLTKLSELIDSLGNPDALNGKLVDLANQHKGRGTTRVHFDNMAVVLLNFLATNLGSAFTPEAKQAWTATMQGINTVVEANA